jgi:hypothetical protein
MKSTKMILLYLVFAITYFMFFDSYSASAKSVPSFVEVGKAYHFRIGVENGYYGRVIEIYKNGWIKLEQIARPLGGKVYREPIIWINTNNTFMIAPPDKNDPRWLR